MKTRYCSLIPGFTKLLMWLQSTLNYLLTIESLQ